MQIHPSDNVEVRDDGQKYALVAIAKGENVIKYGFPIGHAKCDITVGEQISPKNLSSNLAGLGEWIYSPYTPAEKEARTQLGELSRELEQEEARGGAPFH